MRRVAVAVSLVLVCSGCTALDVAGDIGKAGYDVYTAVETTSDAADIHDRMDRWTTFQTQRASGDVEGALTTIRGLIADPVEEDHRFLTASWNADLRVAGIETLRVRVEDGHCDESFPGLADDWMSEGERYAANVAPQTLKSLTVAKWEFDDAYGERCLAG